MAAEPCSRPRHGRPLRHRVAPIHYSIRALPSLRTGQRRPPPRFAHFKVTELTMSDRESAPVTPARTAALPAPNADRIRSIGIYLRLIALVWAVFGQTLRFPFVAYDDAAY